MWLLHAQTMNLSFFHDEDASKEGYAILSHTWDQEEVTFQDIKSLDSARGKKGYEKIYFTCLQAIRDRLNYVWIDTCCIDKSSSAELSEALNSMYKWYQQAEICYAYLSDVTVPIDEVALAQARWFTRGWTLQELIAPHTMNFYGQGWKFCGTKASMAGMLANITRIDRKILSEPTFLPGACVAKKFSWAAHRKTTRVEDQAYCLLGIMGINMVLLYGEGENAFARLQLEIMRTFTDHSILVWHYVHGRELMNNLALSPENYQHANRITSWVWRRPMPMEPTSTGLRLKLPTLKLKDTLHAVLNCRYEDDFSGPIGIPLMLYNQGVTGQDRAVRLVPHHILKTARFPTIPLGTFEDAAQEALLMPSSFWYALPRILEMEHTNPPFQVSILLDPKTDFWKECDYVRTGPQKHWNSLTNVLEWPNHEESDGPATGYIIWKNSRYKHYFLLLFSLSKPSRHAQVKLSRIMWSKDVPAEEQICKLAHRLCSRHIPGPNGQEDYVTKLGEGDFVHLRLESKMIMDAAVCVTRLEYTETNCLVKGKEDGYYLTHFDEEPWSFQAKIRPYIIDDPELRA